MQAQICVGLLYTETALFSAAQPQADACTQHAISDRQPSVADLRLLLQILSEDRWSSTQRTLLPYLFKLIL